MVGGVKKDVKDAIVVLKECWFIMKKITWDWIAAMKNLLVFATKVSYSLFTIITITRTAIVIVVIAKLRDSRVTITVIA